MPNRSPCKSSASVMYVCALFLFLTTSVYASATPAELKAAFTVLLGGRTAKMIWNSPANQVWGMDTKDCIPHKITSDSALPPNTATLNFPSMTWDQKRVIFTNTKNMSVYTANWDSSGGFKKIATGYYTGYAWQGNGKHWVLATPKTYLMAPSTKVVRLNIDSPYDTVFLWNKTQIGGGDGSMHASLSIDGTRMAENLPHPKMGIATVPNGNIVLRQKTEEVCIPTISRDNKYQVLCFTATHTDFCIFDSTGKDILNKSFVNVLPFNSTTNRAEHLRWTNDFDIATVDGCVVRISDLKYIDLDSLIGGVTAIDLYIYEPTPTKLPIRFNMNKPEGAASTTLFDCLGRIMPGSIYANTQLRDRSHFIASGIFLEKSNGNASGTPASLIQKVN